MKKVAVIGMSFRFPETARDRYWDDLLAGRDFVTEVHPSRWNRNRFLHPSKGHRGTTYSFASGSLGDISGFDAGFFGISPREAALMDPQQRLLLELAWEALENSGIRPSDIAGSACGVFIGISSVDYGMRMADDLGAIDALMITGNTSSIAANRISYYFDLHGPSMALDTACSSSLVAFHQACRAVANGDCPLALTGGVSLHLHPLGFVAFSKASMLSTVGHCNVFDAKGDGYVRSEGGGLFILKDHDQAVADGDEIWAVVAGSHVNTDGRKTGLTVPSIAAQTSLLQEAYAAAGIHAREVDYLEAHGTGTPVGDPIEANALGLALGTQRPKESPLLIGSVKSNLGHLEAASGVAGLVKALYCLRHRMVPATIRLNTPNPNIRFDEWNLRVATSNTALSPSGRLVVGVNSFGFGGANAHVILESPAAKITTIHARSQKGNRGFVVPMVVTGKSEAALKAAAGDAARFLRSASDIHLLDICGTAAFRRQWHDHRLIAFGATHKSIAASLEGFVRNDATQGGIVTASALQSPVDVAFVYSGNGSQWEAMGRRLLAEDPVFKASVLAVEQLFDQYADFSLVAEFAGQNGSGRYARTEIAQPALFALQVGITEMLRSRGVHPTVVAGHSVGEVAAGWASGALTLEQAVCVIFHRSRLQGLTHGEGQMTAVALSAAEVEGILAHARLQQAVTIGALNSARSVTVSGTRDSLDILEGQLKQAGHTFKRLDLDYAFHSPQMEPIEAPLRAALADLTPRTANVRLVSTVSGDGLTGRELDAEYWWRNVREPVLFDKAIRATLGQGSTLLIEVGPHPVLKGYMEAALRDCPNHQGRVICTLERGLDSPDRVWRAASQALLAGANVDLGHYFTTPGRLASLPNYPWQRQPLWHGVTSASHRMLQQEAVHPLLGYPIQQVANSWENRIDPRLQPSLGDHRVAGAIVFPGAAFAELGLAMARQQSGIKAVDARTLALEDIDIVAPMVLLPETSRMLRCSMDAIDGRFAIQSRDESGDEPWVVHASGRALLDAGPQRDGALDRPGLPDRAPDCHAEAHQALMRQAGLEYGPAFSGIAGVWVEGDQVWARLVVPDLIGAELETHLLHPAILDCALQLVAHVMFGKGSAEAPVAYVPIRISGLRHTLNSGPPTVARTRVRRATRHTLSASVDLFDEGGHRTTSIETIRFRSIPRRGEASLDDLILESVEIAMPRQHSVKNTAGGLAARLRDSLTTAAQGLLSDPVYANYLNGVEPLLDALVGSFGLKALRELSEGGAFLSDALAGQLVDRQPEAGPLLVWLIDSLEDEGLLSREADGWRIHVDDASPDPESIWRTVMREYPDHFPLTHAVGRVGLHLTELIRGARDATQVMTMGLDAARALPAVFGTAGWSVLEEGLAAAVMAHIEQMPPGQRVTIAEFGPIDFQFGALRRRCLDTDRADYLIVRQAEGADSAEEVLHDLGLNARRPLFRTIRPMDAVDASDCATCALALLVQDAANPAGTGVALRQARQMLVPGGVLVFLALPVTRWSRFVFGVHPEYWGEEGSRAPHQLVADAARYRPMLELAGFPGSTRLAMDDAPVSTSAAPIVLVAECPTADVSAAPTTSMSGPVAVEPGVWVLHSPALETAKSAELIKQLGDAGRFCINLRMYLHGKASGPADLAQALAEIRSEHGAIAGMVDMSDGEQTGATQTIDGRSPASPNLSARCEWAMSLAQACEQLRHPLACWFVVDGSDNDSAIGDAALRAFARTMRNEPGQLTARVIIQDSCGGTVDHEAKIRGIIPELLAPDRETEVRLASNGPRLVPRLRRAARREADSGAGDSIGNVRLGFASPGLLRNLRWERVSDEALRPDEIRVRVEATGLNFRDVMYATGMLPDEALESGFAGATLGLECAGTVVAVGAAVQEFTPGSRVLAFGPSCFGRHVTTVASAATRVPGPISTEAAATIPTTFLTAYYALSHLGHLRPGERILIHGAAGGVGLAALQLARHLGATTFVTAGTEEKRDYLRMAGADHVMDSRTLDFADQILAITSGQGVDLVLNSLTGEALTRSLGILRPFGRFLELGKRDFYENTRVSLRPLRHNISYFAIDADQLLVLQAQLAKQLLSEVMALFAHGALHPLPFAAVEANMVIDAFRLMQRSQHIGKIVVTYRHGIRRIHELPRQEAALQLRPNATYLVTGGLGGFGLETARWLVRRGARHLLLLGRTGAESPQAQTAVTSMRSLGVNVRAGACDVSDGQALQSELEAAAACMPPLRGIVHAAAVFDDGLIRGFDGQRLRKVFAPKAGGAWNLHLQTLDRSLDFFVLYSSVTTAFGNPGQAAYVAANACLESLARLRHANGLPALCVRWGPIGDAGYLSRNETVKRALQSRTGGQPLQSSQALAILEQLIQEGRSGLCVADLNWRTMARLLPAASEPQFGELLGWGLAAESVDDRTPDLAKMLTELPPQALIVSLRSMLKAEIGAILRMPVEKIDDFGSVHDLGLDSLMGVELALAVESRFGVKLPMMALSEGPTVAKLVDRILAQLRAESDATGPTDAAHLQAEIAIAAEQHAVSTDSETVLQLAADLQTARATGANVRMIR